MTYGEIARSAGNPRAHRAAGTALGANPLPIVVPATASSGAGKDPGNYGGGPELKRWLLELEGSCRLDNPQSTSMGSDPTWQFVRVRA